MALVEWIQILIFIGALFITVPLLGSYMALVFEGKPTFLHPVLEWLETLTYRVSGINPADKMHWKTYVNSILLFSLWGFLTVFLLQIFQAYLPLNPQNFGNVPVTTAFNAASSFATNTGWESYAPETSYSYTLQILGVTVQYFLSAATGLSVAVAFIRGITNRNLESLGNFWQDMVRSVVYILLPLSLALALFLTTQGVVQTLLPYIEMETLEGGKQTLPLGPAASQIAIKQLGSNCGGFFKANSAHPIENPNGLTNFIEMLAILAIPAATTYMYGTMVKSRKHGWILFFVMFSLWCVSLGVSLYSEYLPNPVLGEYPVLEGKEVRFGISSSILWTISSTASSNGSTNAVLTSLSPLAGGCALFNMMLGEVIFGGIGTGLCSMLMFVLLTVFLSGLIVGRTPEYIGKKIEKREMQWIIIAIVIPGVMILAASGVSCILPAGLKGITSHGPHGLTSVIYAFSSAAGNNGSKFTALIVTSNYYNLLIGVIMIIGRIAILIPSIAVAGYLSQKEISVYSSGTYSTATIAFAILLTGVILIFGILTFFPAISLGPLIEHFFMLHGKSY